MQGDHGQLNKFLVKKILSLKVLVLRIARPFPHDSLNKTIVHFCHNSKTLVVLDARLCNLSTGHRIPIKQLPKSLEVLRLFLDAAFTDQAVESCSNLKVLEMCMSGDAIKKDQVMTI